MFRFVLCAAVLAASVASAQQPQFYGWMQPAKRQPISYATPLRDLLFGKTRLVPVGPPVPYYLVPGRVVPPQIVYPREIQPQIVWPDAPVQEGK